MTCAQHQQHQQLRQRVAWALYQILPIGGPRIKKNINEGGVAYYDIFTRNAFGSYLDVLREVSFNREMSIWLTFQNNMALQYQLDHNGASILPDENYARYVLIWKQLSYLDVSLKEFTYPVAHT